MGRNGLFVIKTAELGRRRVMEKLRVGPESLAEALREP